ncbi:hypothetical protein D3C76_1495740 [compost metagenome]
MLQCLGAVFLVHLALQLLPDRQGKVPGLGDSGGEWAGRLKVVHASALQHRYRSATQLRWLIAQNLVLALSPRQVPRALRHEASTAHAPFDEALCVQLAVSRLHGIPRDAQRLGQWPGSRQ